MFGEGFDLICGAVEWEICVVGYFGGMGFWWIDWSVEVMVEIATGMGHYGRKRRMGEGD